MGLSWTFGAAINREVTPNVEIGLSAKGFLFRTDTNLTTYGSHLETLSNGQKAAVLDVSHSNNSADFNAVLFAASIRWK